MKFIFLMQIKRVVALKTRPSGRDSGTGRIAGRMAVRTPTLAVAR